MSRMKFLDGIRVIDCTRLLPGAFASLYLADMGADVIKVEHPRTGDYMRSLFRQDLEKDSRLFQSINRNKRSVTLDLKSSLGREIFLKLVATADVVMESFRPGVTDRLGIGYEACREVNPSIIYAAITGWGQTGPYADLAGHDLNYLSIAGLTGLTKDEKGKPILIGTQVADLNGAWQAVIGILGALIRKIRDGSGCFLDISMLDGVISWETLLFSQLMTRTGTFRAHENILLGDAVCYNVYKTKDDKFVSLGCIEPKFWSAFCYTVNRPEWVPHQFDKANGEGVHSQMIELFRQRTRDDWFEVGKRADCCLFPVLELKEVVDDPHVRARNVFKSNHPTIDGPLIRFPVQSRNDEDGWIPIENAVTAPQLGQDTETILTELGYQEKDLHVLRMEGIISIYNMRKVKK